MTSRDPFVKWPIYESLSDSDVADDADDNGDDNDDDKEKRDEAEGVIRFEYQFTVFEKLKKKVRSLTSI